MYVILVYDVEQERVNKVCTFLRRYLNWVQNSAFEGELSAGQLAGMKAGLEKIIQPNRDSVYIYTLRDVRWIRKEVLGIDKAPTDNFL